MKRLINGIEKLNKNHFRLSMDYVHRPGNRFISQIDYVNDLEFENHHLKPLKYKQFLSFNKKSLINRR